MLGSLDVLENKMILFLSKLLMLWGNRQVHLGGSRSMYLPWEDEDG